MIATLRRLMLVSAGAIALSAPGLAQVSADISKALSAADAAYQRADYAEAARWLRVAAEQGDATAQFNLAVLYDTGEGLQQNYAEAVRWYRLAADQNYAEAQSNLGAMYFTGEGVTQNYAEAVRWFSLAADQGDAEAQSNLGGMYYEGEGVTQNIIEAYKWWSLAVAQGDGGTATKVQLVRVLMTPEQIAEGERRVAEWKPK